jgi:hypothetical protein
MSHQVSLRIPDHTFSRLSRRRKGDGTPLSSIVNTALEEWLRMEEHPGIVFKPGPAGRRPAISRGPDVWELIQAYRDMSATGGDAVRRTAEHLCLSERQVQTGLRYYAEHADEIDEWIRTNDEIAVEAEAAWLREQAVLGV